MAIELQTDLGQCAGCEGACCKDVSLIISPSDFRYFVGQNPLIELKLCQALNALYDSHSGYPDGTYYANARIDGEDSMIAVITGSCPNLKLGGVCGIYPQRPENCRNFVVGGQSCEESRRQEGLKPINPKGLLVRIMGRK